MGYSHYQRISHAESTISIGHSSISPTLWETLQLVKFIRNEPTISAVFCSPSFDDYSNCMLFWQANCSVIVQNQSKIALSQCNFRFYPPSNHRKPPPNENGPGATPGRWLDAHRKLREGAYFTASPSSKQSPHWGQNLGGFVGSSGVHPQLLHLYWRGAVGLGEPHSGQNFPVHALPHTQVQPVGSGLGLPHSGQNLPVHALPHSQVQPPAAGAGAGAGAGAATGVGTGCSAMAYRFAA